MVDMDAVIYGRDKRVSIRFFWIAVAIYIVTSTIFFIRESFPNNQQFLIPSNLYLVLVALLILFAISSAIANAYFEGGFTISLLNATAVALAFGFATAFSFITGADGHTDAPQVLVFATFAGISAFGGLIAWGVGNALRGLKSGSGRK